MPNIKVAYEECKCNCHSCLTAPMRIRTTLCTYGITASILHSCHCGTELTQKLKPTHPAGPPEKAMQPKQNNA